MANVRFGLVGYGAWGRHHARAIREVDRAELVAIAAHSETSCRAARDDHPDAAVYADYRDMLSAESLDAVDVVVPSHLHRRVVGEALVTGCHVLVEKPMALSIADCTEMIELARARHRLLAVGHELRLSSLWGRVRKMIDEGRIGAPLYALIELWRRPYRRGSAGWRYDKHRVGSWILEEPIHFFDLARWYLACVGEPATVVAQANSKQPDRPELHDNFSAIVRFSGGPYAVISQTLGGWEHHQSVKLTGTAGALWASWSGAMDRTFEPVFSLKCMTGDEVETIVIDRPSGEVFELVHQLETFTRAARGEATVACTGEDGRWAVRMCLAAEASIEEGRAISLDDGRLMS